MVRTVTRVDQPAWPPQGTENTAERKIDVPLATSRQAGVPSGAIGSEVTVALAWSPAWRVSDPGEISSAPAGPATPRTPSNTRVRSRSAVTRRRPGQVTGPPAS